MADNNQIAPVVEMCSAVLTHGLDADGVKALKSDAGAFIKSQLDTEIVNANSESVAINVVENSGKEMHLVLPYYDGVEDLAAKALAEAELSNIAGGEIIISLCIAAGFGIGAALAGGLTATAPIVGGVIGGVVGVAATAAVAGASAGTILSTPDKTRKKTGINRK